MDIPSGFTNPEFIPMMEESQMSEDLEDKDRKKEKKKKLEPLTVEDLLNIPLPKEGDKKSAKEEKGSLASTIYAIKHFTIH